MRQPSFSCRLFFRMTTLRTGRRHLRFLPKADRVEVVETNKPTYVAEIANIQGGILVTIFPPESTTTFSRSFHAICDAERWLARLARVGLRSRDCARLLEKELLAFELAATGPIRVVDNRRSKRCSLPEYFT